MDAENYANLTRPWFTSHSPFPLNFFVPGRQASLALSRILLTKAESPLLNITEVEGKVWENRSTIMYNHNFYVRDINCHALPWIHLFFFNAMVKWKCLRFCIVRWKTVYLRKIVCPHEQICLRWSVETRGSWNMLHNKCAIVVMLFLIIMNIKIVWLVIEFLLDLQWSQRVPEFALPQTWELPFLLWRRVSFSLLLLHYIYQLFKGTVHPKIKGLSSIIHSCRSKLVWLSFLLSWNIKKIFCENRVSVFCP